MLVEEKLKNLILSRYKSIREFTLSIDIPNSTMDSILKRGIGNSSVTNIIKICKALNISADELSLGRISPVDDSRKENYTDVNDIITDTKNKLRIYGLTMDGAQVDKKTIEEIIDAIEIGVSIVKNKKQGGGANDVQH